MKRNILLLILVLLILLSLFISCKKTVAEKGAGEQQNLQITVDRHSRTFIVYTPSGYSTASKIPLLFSVHGGGGDGASMVKLAGFQTIADREKFIVVYPDGISKSWNDGRPTDANSQGIDDVNFFRQLCIYMNSNYAVDPSRIYATGISNGGFMCTRLGCELSDKIAAIAPVAGTYEKNTMAPACHPSNPVPAIYIHGTTDPLVPFEGGVMDAGAGGTILSHDQAVSMWVTLDQCNTSPVITNLPDIANDGTTIQQTTYTNGTNGSQVIGYTIQNGGHTWPQGWQYLPEIIIGKTSQDMNACEVIWQFFKRFSR